MSLRHGADSDGWKFTDERSGVYETRHEAVGEAAVWARERRERYDAHTAMATPAEASARVYAYKPYHCSFCGETFLTESEEEEHRPCPQWQSFRRAEETDTPRTVPSGGGE